MIRTFLATVAITLVTACSTVQVTDYSDARPLLDIEQFLTVS